MAYAFSVINLKGGVGKTTTTVALAEALANFQRKRVLVIDVDPQTNATIVMIGDNRWKELNDAKLTIAQLFRDALDGTKLFDFEKSVQRNVFPKAKHGCVDLLPSSLDLIDTQELLATAKIGTLYTGSPSDILRSAVRAPFAEYDYVIVDCPPNVGLITLNALRISNGYVIPTVPDLLSTWGIPQIRLRVKRFADEAGITITELGTIVTKFQKQSAIHESTLNEIRMNERRYPHPFATVIPQGNQIAGAMDFDPRLTFSQRYREFGTIYERLSTEIMTRAELLP